MSKRPDSDTRQKRFGNEWNLEYVRQRLSNLPASTIAYIQKILGMAPSAAVDASAGISADGSPLPADNGISSDLVYVVGSLLFLLLIVWSVRR